MKNLKTYLIYAATGLAGILIGALFFSGDSDPQLIDEHISEAHTDAHGEIVYTCSMHPQIRQDEPGNCPICGMDLIPAEEASPAAGPDDLVMTRAAMKLAEIETTPVTKSKAVSTLHLPGKVTVNKNKSSAITSHISGRITELYVDFEGDYVEAGERVASIYSPELIAAQQELFETAKYKNQNPVLYQAARRKLELWELPISTINEIEAGNRVMESVDIVSPVSGFVQQINVQRQQHVKEGSLMYQVADLSSVWVMFDAYESDLALLETGQQIRFTTPSYPGQNFSGSVDYIDPMVQNTSRSLKIRVMAENSQYKLKPNMLTEGILDARVGNTNQLLVPKSAVLWTGTRSVVFVQKTGTEEPTFTAREIVLGERAGNHYIVLEGLEEGEQVVTNGTFKLDSAAQLADKLSMMNRNPGTRVNRSGHEDHMMDQSSETMQNTHPGETGSRQPHSHNEHLDKLLTDYLKMKDALASDDFETAKQALSSFSEEVRSSSEMNDHAEHAQKHEKHHGMMLSAVNAASRAENITQLRSSFDEITNELLTAIQNQDYADGTLYVQFCPMQNDGDGARWLSREPTIKNPYFGKKMLRCGNTIEIIE